MSLTHYIFKDRNQFASEIEHIYIDNDIRKFIDKYNNYDNANIHLKPCVNHDIFNMYYIRSLAEYTINCKLHNSINFMKILIDEYDFVPDEDFRFIMRRMTFEMFKLFYNYFEITKSIDIVQSIFFEECRIENLDNVKHIINIGYDINDLNIIKAYIGSEYEYNNTAIHQVLVCNQYQIMEYLLEIGINYKIHEVKILKHCILSKNTKMLTLFINHGANITVLNNKNNIPCNDTINIYNLLLSSNIDPLIICNLLIPKPGKYLY